MNNYFCVLPFFAFELGTQATSNIYCCRLQPNTKIENVRKNILNQARSPECESCWKLEDAGIESERQVHNRTFDWLRDKDLEIIEKQVRQGNYSSQIVKIATSNLCNGQCIICSPEASSAWSMLKPNKKIYQLIPEKLLIDIDWNNVVYLMFLGGEPLLEKKNFEILQRLLDSGNTNCLISFTTNGSIELTEYQKNLLSRFHRLNFCLSIDGINKNFEYLRFPLKWDTLLSNLSFFRALSKNISVSYTLTNIGIFNYAETVNFFKENNLPYTCKPVQNPDYFKPSNLPIGIKNLILAKNKEYKTELEFLLNQEEFNIFTYKSFLTELYQQDNLKKINIKDYMPEVCEVLYDRTYLIQENN